MDAARCVPHFAHLYPFFDAPDQAVRVLVYPVPDSAPQVPYPHVFYLRFWDAGNNDPEPTLGFRYEPIEKYLGPLPSNAPGEPCGTADQWAGGCSYAVWLAGGYECHCPGPIMPQYVSSIISPDGTIVVTHAGTVWSIDVNRAFNWLWTGTHTIRVSDPGAYFTLQDNLGNPMFQLNDEGKIVTNQLASGTPPATSDTILTLFDADGNQYAIAAKLVVPVPPPVVLLDQFSDSDGTALHDHVIAPINDPGATWGTFGSGIEIFSDMATDVGGAPVAYALNFTVLPLGLSATITLAGGSDAGLVFWADSPSAYWIVNLDPTANTVSIYQNPLAGGGALASASFTLDPGTAYIVELTLDTAGNVSVKIDATTVLSYEAPAAPTGTGIGLWRGGAAPGVTGTTWQNFKANG